MANRASHDGARTFGLFRLEILASLASQGTTIKPALVNVSFSLVLFGFLVLAITLLPRLSQARQFGRQR